MELSIRESNYDVGLVASVNTSFLNLVANQYWHAGFSLSTDMLGDRQGNAYAADPIFHCFVLMCLFFILFWDPFWDRKWAWNVTGGG